MQFNFSELQTGEFDKVSLNQQSHFFLWCFFIFGFNLTIREMFVKTTLSHEFWPPVSCWGESSPEVKDEATTQMLWQRQFDAQCLQRGLTVKFNAIQASREAFGWSAVNLQAGPSVGIARKWERKHFTSKEDCKLWQASHLAFCCQISRYFGQNHNNPLPFSAENSKNTFPEIQSCTFSSAW